MSWHHEAIVSWGVLGLFYFYDLFLFFSRAALDDFVEYVDDLVDVVDERGVEDDDDDLDSVFLANLPCPA